MKDLTAKVMPIVMGAVIGWMLYHPPAFLAPLGALRYLVMVLAGAVLLVGTVVMSVAAALPRAVSLTPTTAAIDPVMRSLVDGYLALGFQLARPVYTVGMAPAATMVGLVHPTEPVFGTVFRTGTIPPVVASDFVSLLEGERGGLTTSANPRGGTLPGDDGSFRQCLVGAKLQELFAAHREAVAWLRRAAYAAARSPPPRSRPTSPALWAASASSSCLTRSATPCVPSGAPRLRGPWGVEGSPSSPASTRRSAASSFRAREAEGSRSGGDTGAENQRSERRRSAVSLTQPPMAAGQGAMHLAE